MTLITVFIAAGLGGAGHGGGEALPEVLPARSRTRSGAINGQVEETFSGHAVVKAFGQEDATVERFNATNGRLYESAWKSQFISGLMQPIMNFVGNLGYVAVAVAGSFFAVQGIITVGDIQAFIQYVKNFTQPITQLTQVSNVLQQMAAAAERIFAFLGEPEEVPDRVSARTEDVACTVEFDHVRFGYDPEKPVIKDFSAKVGHGQTVAIVGPTGAGKTTMVKLLMRFYDVQAGAIRIGGHDVREFAREDLRSLFGMVLQDTWLFRGSILRQHPLRQAGRHRRGGGAPPPRRRCAAPLHPARCPAATTSSSTRTRSNISQGQTPAAHHRARHPGRPRACSSWTRPPAPWTRAPKSAYSAAMDNLMAGRTSFVIAHRLSTIRSADLILVMAHGDIVEQGTHEELLSLGGFYADLYNSQFVECIDEIED